MSERDGWNHLYLFDGVTGAVKNQITRGEWVVRGVSRVDEEKRQIWFSGSGMYPGQDPYFVYYYRINFDGTGLTRLTEAEANHAASFSEDGAFFVDVYSRVDQGPVSELRRASDGSLVTELERVDLAALQKAGWRPPEVFTAKGRDGQTDIWGVIYRPTTFDPRKKYPVIENIYAGPHSSFVPKSFSAFSAMQAQADIGFIVVQIDGMGTSNRSKAFHDVAWKNIKDAGFPGPHPVAQGRRGEVPLLRHLARRHLRHVGRRPELARRAALPPGVLQGGGLGRRLPRQPDGQDLVERAVDGLADRPGIRRLVERGQRVSPAGEGAARRRRDGHERGSLVDDAGGECAHQGEQDVRPAGDPGRRARTGRARTASGSATTSSCSTCSARRRRRGTRSRRRRRRPRRDDTRTGAADGARDTPRAAVRAVRRDACRCGLPAACGVGGRPCAPPVAQIARDEGLGSFDRGDERLVLGFAPNAHQATSAPRGRTPRGRPAVRGRESRGSAGRQGRRAPGAALPHHRPLQVSRVSRSRPRRDRRWCP